MTVAELRAALATMEQNWSAEDLSVLGGFDHQTICVDTFAADGSYAGIGTPEPSCFDACFGFMLLAARPRRKA